MIRWHRFRAVIVGRHTGVREPLHFMRFRHHDQAQEWCNNMNAANAKFGFRLTWYEVEPIR